MKNYRVIDHNYSYIKYHNAKSHDLIMASPFL